MSRSAFLLALACEAPDEFLNRAFDAARAGGGVESVAAAARGVGLTARLGRFLATRGTQDDDTRRAIASGMLAESRGTACLELLRDLACVTGAEALVVKGASLILGGVSDLDREIGDVDLLVRVEDLPAWLEAARAAGAAVQPCAEAHELAYVRRGPALVELHAALPAAVGKDRGPGWDAVRSAAVAEPVPGYGRARPVLGRAAREITVHHFVFHHGGHPAHAFRALQDLARLGDARGPGLEWGAHRPDAALERLSRVVTEVKRGARDGSVAEFLRWFDPVQDLSGSAEAEFADVIDRWLALRKTAGEGRATFVLSRLFPRGLPIGDALARPFRLAGRYLAGAAQRSRPGARRVIEWRRFLEGT